MAPPREAPPGRVNFGRAILMGVLAFVLWKTTGWVYWRFIESEEDHIRETLQSAVDGANERSPRGVTRILSMDFRGPHDFTRDAVHNACISLLMQQYRVVKFELSPNPIPVQLDAADPKKAIATFKVSGKGKSSEDGEWEDIGRLVGRYFSDDGGATLKASFKKTDEGWQMYTIELLQTGKP